VHFFLQLSVLVVSLVVFRHPVGWAYLLLLPLALLALVQLTVALALLLSAANVYLRDIAHFVELALLGWFWVTPIIYPFQQITEAAGGRAWPPLLNPVTPIVLTFQRAFYGLFGDPPVLRSSLEFSWYLRNLMIVGGASFVLLLIALRVFRRLEGNFAEEL
jgi:ABC-2 type transport system permease protein